MGPIDPADPVIPEEGGRGPPALPDLLSVTRDF